MAESKVLKQIERMERMAKSKVIKDALAYLRARCLDVASEDARETLLEAFATTAVKGVANALSNPKERANAQAEAAEAAKNEGAAT